MLMLGFFFKQLIRCGRLSVIDAGEAHIYQGEPMDMFPPVTIRLHDPSIHWKLPLRPALTVGDAYMDGTLTIEEGTLYDFLAMVSENVHRLDRRYSPRTLLRPAAPVAAMESNSVE